MLVNSLINDSYDHDETQRQIRRGKTPKTETNKTIHENFHFSPTVVMTNTVSLNKPYL